MAKESVDSANLGGDGDGDKSNWSTSNLIFSLKSTFQADEYAEVEKIIVSREGKLKMEIKELKQNRGTILENYEAETLEKMRLQDELKKCQTERQEMCKKVSNLRDENMGLETSLKNAEERNEKLLAQVKELCKKVNELGDKEIENNNLRVRNHEVELEKAKLESELTALRKKFGELDKRVLSLENELPLLKNSDDVIRVENGNSATVGVKSEDVAKVEDVSFGNSAIKTNGNSQNAESVRLTPQNVIEIGDSDDESAPVDNSSEKGTTLLHPADKACSDQIGPENGNPTTLKRKQTSSCGESEKEDDRGTRKSKMMKPEEPVCKPADGPLNHRSSRTTTSDSNEVNKGITTPKEDLMVSRQHERQMEPQPKAQNLLNGFPLDGLRGYVEESSCSSDSDSDDDNDAMPIFFNHSQLPPEGQKENKN
ncbi:hypothetical protein CCACVL1_13494 [Corchorus capsularis]|uniref:Uncharacterized protein n=1 Tax=Corchorus capsularis TaxID=210143 RepID=A0A1R3IAX1_COCAP|nr:hypothetical protein CCACVL1_13494 [Corchorus capsularis]